MARTSVNDPIKVFRFKIEISDFPGGVVGFSEMSGMESETEVTEYREGGMNDTPQKSPGLTKFADIVFKRGQLVSTSTNLGLDLMWNWMTDIYDVSRGTGTIMTFRRLITVSQMTSLNQVGRKWEIYECFPKKFKPFTDLNGTSSDNSIEELTIAHEGFRRTL